eukprot:3378932-Pyramimonas_sp.AAC.1
MPKYAVGLPPQLRQRQRGIDQLRTQWQPRGVQPSPRLPRAIFAEPPNNFIECNFALNSCRIATPICIEQVGAALLLDGAQPLALVLGPSLSHRLVVRDGGRRQGDEFSSQTGLLRAALV